MIRPSLAALAIAASAAFAIAAPAAKDGLKDDKDRTLYSFGFQMGRNVGTLGFNEGEIKALTTGLRDAALRKEPAVNMSVFLPKVNELIEQRVAKKNAAEKEKGKAFAVKFGKEPGVLPIEGGGFLKHETDGKGQSPSPEDTVKVHYRGTLVDGTEFDSSYKRNEPTSFPLKGVIPCWTRGVAMMKPGGKAKLVCPSEIAYGEQGHPPVIPGGATLVFDVELLEVQKGDAKKP